MKKSQQQTNPYKAADKELLKVLATIRREFNKNRLRNFLPFDEINLPKLKKSIKSLYEKLDNINRTFFLKIARQAYSEACEEIGFKGKGIDEKWVIAMLNSADHVTEYVYTRETKRKQERFYEALLAILVLKHTNADIEREYKKAAKFWQRQTEQYEINSIDYARLRAFDEAGEEYVRWHTQEDGRVCAECQERDGQVYSIDDIPESHYNCRCWIEAVTD